MPPKKTKKISFQQINFSPTDLERFGHEWAAWVVLGMYAVTLWINLIARWQLGNPIENRFILASLYDPIYISLIFGLVVTSWLVQDFFNSAPTFYTKLLSQKVFQEKDKGKSIQEFVERYNLWINNPQRVIWGLISMSLGLILIFFIIYDRDFSRLWLPNEKLALGADSNFYIVIWLTNLINSLGFMLAMYGGGILLYKLQVTARMIFGLPNYFKLSLQPDHPDKVGGFLPIGHLCLKMVYAIIPSLIVTSFWLLAVKGRLSFLNPENSLPVYSQGAFSGLFSILLFGLLIAGAVVFLWPMWTIHEYMRERKYSDKETNILILEIDKLNRKATSPSSKVDAAERKALLAEIDVLKEVYARQNKVPTWPIERSVALKFLSVQIIPILSFLFQGNFFVELLQRFVP